MTPRATGSRCASPARCLPEREIGYPMKCSAFRRRKVRVVVGDVGGGFGMKTSLYPEGHPRGLRRAPIEAPGEMDGRADRGVSGGDARARCREPRRARPRRERQGAGLSRPLARLPCMRLCAGLPAQPSYLARRETGRPLRSPRTYGLERRFGCDRDSFACRCQGRFLATTRRWPSRI